MSRRSLALLSALVLISLAPAAQAAEDKALRAAVAGPVRTEANTVRDGARHPYETLAFWGVKPSQTVIEISPGTGYWTEILAPYAKATGGRYIASAADLDNPALSEGARKGRAAFEARYADETKFGKVALVNFGSQSKPLGAPASADMVITARNIHNWLWQPPMLDKAMADFHAVLKPGGVLAVEEHRADPRPQKGDARDGYVAVATVVAAAQKAGFKLAGASEINANPKDTKDHPFGVWTLPPSRYTTEGGKTQDPAFDRARFDAIGESDRMTLRFVKPG
ncbi:class I SAM-dependent methyltransferase [Phenylobacterium sp.]|uniref:class I SAM-dependent methyltransferase n=1 Tax=Phenylobacterium sp. TaxID=1871053 RepID=UPI00271CF2E3|nr:methyltransferase [Phenylobacterium sp.]MDO8378230.1 methyltransferase [Phenylobacterium sp.]